jgi:hypothetical protein
MARFSPNHINYITRGKCVLSGLFVDERRLRILRISVLAATFALQDRVLPVAINFGMIFVICSPICFQIVKYLLDHT